MGLSDFEVAYGDSGFKGEDLRTNLILLGGPDYNDITRKAISKIESNLKFGDPKRHEIAFFDALEDNRYIPRTSNESGEVVLDYGVIIRQANPFDLSKQLLLIAGSFGFGTWAGVRFVTSLEFLEHPLVSNGRPVEFLIETDVVLETPQAISPLVTRSFEEST
jgi:hypothetical protein